MSLPDSDVSTPNILQKPDKHPAMAHPNMRSCVRRWMNPREGGERWPLKHPNAEHLVCIHDAAVWVDMDTEVFTETTGSVYDDSVDLKMNKHFTPQKGTFESMIFLFPFGGICDRSLEGTYYCLMVYPTIHPTFFQKNTSKRWVLCWISEPSVHALTMVAYFWD